MRLLYITPGLEAGGAERHASILLPGLRQRGVDARALALGPGGTFVEPLRDGGVDVEVLNMRHRLDLARVFRARLVQRFSPDLVVSRAVNGLYVGEAIAVSRGAAHVHNDHTPVGAPWSTRRALMGRSVARRLALVILVSEDQRDPWLRLGCPSDRIVVIANGVDTVTRLRGQDELRRDLGLPPSSVVAVSLASLTPRKHVDDFVRAIIEAQRRHPELLGVVVGEGPERPVVERVAAGNPAIHVLGLRDDVGRILQAADMLVLTSEAEALPMAIIEGMAAGLPVIATQVGGVPGMVDDGETGLLIPPRDPAALVSAIVRLASDRDSRVTMGRMAAKRCSERWDAASMVDAYADAFEHALTRRHRGMLRGSGSVGV